jgi:hypothetical protein
LDACAHPPVAQQDDAVGERYCLHLVMGDIDHGGGNLSVPARDLEPHLQPEGRVEVRERLVEQEHLGRAHQRSAHGNALALPARQRRRIWCRSAHTD